MRIAEKQVGNKDFLHAHGGFFSSASRKKGMRIVQIFRTATAVSIADEKENPPPKVKVCGKFGGKIVHLRSFCPHFREDILRFREACRFCEKLGGWNVAFLSVFSVTSRVFVVFSVVRARGGALSLRSGSDAEAWRKEGEDV